MATASDLIKASLRSIGVIAPGESLEAAESKDALATLNRLIDSWSNERLLIHEISRDEHTLTASTNPHTIGSSGDINTTRPLKIVRAGLKESGEDIEHLIELIDFNRWRNIPDKSTESSIPYYLWYNPEYPLGKIYLYPICDAANTLVLYTWAQLSQLSALTTSVSLPEGYEQMLVFNLAIVLAGEYGRPIPPSVEMIARESKANIKRLNVDMSELEFDSALPGVRGSWDYRSDSWR